MLGYPKTKDLLEAETTYMAKIAETNLLNTNKHEKKGESILKPVT